MASRNQNTRHTVNNMRSVWSSSCYSLKTKLKLADSVVKAKLLYGCECWTVTKATEKRLQVFHRYCLRRILKIFYPNRISNDRLYKSAKQMDVVDRTRCWICHITGKDPGHLTRQSFCFQGSGGGEGGHGRRGS